MIILVNILWLLYSMIEGGREAFYWHFKNNSRVDYKFEIHPLFSFQRGIVLSLIGLVLFNIICYYSIISIISMMLIFSFFHNGTYYLIRNKLDNNVYKLKWTDQSSTSTAKMTKIMTYKSRTIFMIVGIISQIFIYIYLKNN